MKRNSLLDAAVVGILGSAVAYFNRGEAAAEGFVLGAAAAALYLVVLQKDVDQLRPGCTPYDTLNPLRIVRQLIPLLMVAAVGLTSALSVGVDTWLDGLNWIPGKNFDGFSPPTAIFGAAIGYVTALLPLQVRGFLNAAPEARTLVEALPGSMGVAMNLKKQADASSEESQAAKPRKPLPILLVSGPRGCGKSSLVKRLRQEDPRFIEPKWIATGDVGDGVARDMVSEEQFMGLAKAGSLAVNYRPYSEASEDQIGLGLPAVDVLAAAMEGRACVLDVDPPTARLMLEYNWERAMAAIESVDGVAVEVRLVAVWVTLPSLDAIMERNKANIEASGSVSESTLQKQLKPLRKQATADIEWALTSGSFEWTIMNQDSELSAKELVRASGYCWGDPF